MYDLKPYTRIYTFISITKWPLSRELSMSNLVDGYFHELSSHQMYMLIFYSNIHKN